jgi:lipid II:glycine glycyltransferase (peptidoglycan interpeptide bridge formation enzyme)
MAPSALQAAIMASAIDRGCTTYDLYGVDARGDRIDHPYRRLSQFKRRFGGANRVYAGAHDLYSYDRIADAMLPFLQHLAVEEARPVGSLRDPAHEIRCRRPDIRLEHFPTGSGKV